MHHRYTRRQFLQTAAAGAAAAGTVYSPANLGRRARRCAAGDADRRDFRISLAEWSLHRALFGGELDPLDFARTARQDFAIEAVEYVNQFFRDKAQDDAYLDQLNRRAADHGVRQLLIMVDGEGRLGDPEPAKRRQAVRNHHKWVDAAVALGCHTVRVNAASAGSYEEQQQRAADGLAALTEYGAAHKINIVVENHGGLSSNGKWLAGVLKMVNSPYCGSLPDFGNFDQYDRYQGVAELMPFAKAVSAKSHDFDDQGNEIHTDYFRMMKIVLDAGYRGYVGIEYEGRELSEPEGIRATKRLLERVRAAEV